MGEEGLMSDEEATCDEFVVPFIMRNICLQRDMFPRSSHPICDIFQGLLYGVPRVIGDSCSFLLSIYLSPKGI
jgi:hypothetical protein